MRGGGWWGLGEGVGVVLWGLKGGGRRGGGGGGWGWRLRCAGVEMEEELEV